MFFAAKLLLMHASYSAISCVLPTTWQLKFTSIASRSICRLSLLSPAPSSNGADAELSVRGVGGKVAVADMRRRQAPLIETSRSLPNKQREPERRREGERVREKGGREEAGEQFRLRGSRCAARSLVFAGVHVPVRVRVRPRCSRPFAFRQVV